MMPSTLLMPIQNVKLATQSSDPTDDPTPCEGTKWHYALIMNACVREVSTSLLLGIVLFDTLRDCCAKIFGSSDAADCTIVDGCMKSTPSVTVSLSRHEFSRA